MPRLNKGPAADTAPIVSHIVVRRNVPPNV